ncbi:MAG: hypothetical protein EOO20_16400 [Chryseobacterium sp.]|nr:MAG: hypothetical protein EOO20_16400 [Chryseobacterium sp.]
MKNFTIRIFLITLLLQGILLNTYAQEAEYHGVDAYLDTLHQLETEALKKEGLLDSSGLRIAKQYRKPGKECFTPEAYVRYESITMDVRLSFFKDFMYQQHIMYNDEAYVLYFSMDNNEDAEWQILKFDKGSWHKETRISKQHIAYCSIGSGKQCDFQPIAFKYREGNRNLENVKMFVKNDFLVLERDGIYQSLFDLKHQKLVFKEENPAYTTKEKVKENLLQEERLHEKINQVINQ